MSLRLVLAFMALAVAQVFGMYSAKSGVVKLDPDNFDKLVVNGDAVWMVEFYAPWCGHCKSLAPEYTKLAGATAGVAKVGAVDADQFSSLGSRFGVQGFPTIKIFGLDKKKPSEYQGPRDAKGLSEALMREVKNVVSSRLNGGSGSGKKKDNKSKGSGSKGDKVVELTNDNFDELVVNSKESWLVAFTAPWCGHCKSLKPEWKSAAAKLDGKVKLGNVDATAHEQLAQRFQVQGYPTIKVFSGTGASRRNGEEYNGGRSAEDIVRVALTLAPPPEVLELVNPEQFKVCAEEMCIVTFVPSLYEADASARKKLIKTVKEVSGKNAGQQLNWFWVAAGQQKKLQEVLMRGSTAFPAVYALNAAKKISASMRSAFDAQGLGVFIIGLSTGRAGQTQKLAGLPEIVNADKWDGKDAAPIAIDEISLDELYGDDDDDDDAKDEL